MKWFLILLLIGTPVVLAETAEIKLEGVVEGLGEQPDELTAMINGAAYKAGQVIGDYKIAAIEAAEVTLQHEETGELITINTGEVLGAAPEVKETAAVAEKSFLEKFTTKHFPQLIEFQQRAQYAGLIRDLKKVHMAAMIHVLNTGEFNVSIRTLVAKGDLPAFMNQARKDHYHFRIMPAKQGVRVYAEPTENTAGKLHFMIDEHSYVYVEEGQRAATTSSRYDNNYAIEIT